MTSSRSWKLTHMFSASTDFKQDPFSFLCAPLLLMTHTDSERYTQSWFFFLYLRMNRCADFNQSSFVVISALCWQSCLEPNLHDKLRLWLSSDLPANTNVGTILICKKYCAHIFKRPENMPCDGKYSTVLMLAWAEDIISPQCEINCYLTPFHAFHWFVFKGFGSWVNTRFYFCL